MLDFIVLGIIPGTNISLGFTVIMILMLFGFLTILKRMGTIHTPQFIQKIETSKLPLAKVIKHLKAKKIREISI